MRRAVKCGTSGLLEEEFTITPQELSALACVSRSATGAAECPLCKFVCLDMCAF
ncbi:MAG: hypothetical protein LIO58_07145 [Oscillospiraceae bacterium]|nr:hypothetical protein [Oscillospiraceae bacterium]